MTTCRRCPAPIVFVSMRGTGRLMPIDPHPDPLGNVVCARDEYGRYLDGHVVPVDGPITDGYRRYMPHFSTCGRLEKPAPAPADAEPWPPPLF